MSRSASGDRLELGPDEMREFGYRVVDLIIDHLATLRDQPVTRSSTRDEMEALFREPMPETPSDPTAVLERVKRDVLSHVMYLNHPRFFGWVPGPINFVSVMAESIGAALNPFMGSWLVSPAPTEIELVTVDWLRQCLGMPEAAGGLLTSGGSMANLSALAVARRVELNDRISGAVIYCSDETHSSIERAVMLLGFEQDQLRQLPSDDGFRLDPLDLDAAIERDLLSGLCPFCVVANAGTTNSGAVDPLEEIAEVCKKRRLWFHVDGAYGAPAVITKAGRPLFRGMERADSISLDPHKWLFQPYEVGCVLVRDRRLLPRTFSIFRDYMRDAVGREDEVNLRDYGPQLTRNFRALKLWMSIQVFGFEAIRAAISHGIELAELAERRLRASDEWEIVTPAQIGIITFRLVPPRLAASPAEEIDELTRRLGREMYADGYALISSTELAGRPVLRLCTINPRTREEDIAGTISKLRSFDRREEGG